MEKTYKVEVRDKSKTVLFKNKIVRTPTTIIVEEKLLGLLKAQFRQKAIEDFTIKDASSNIELPDILTVDEEFIIEESKEVKVEELCEDKPKTILDKLLHDNN